jgi:hypothetical protein
MAKQTIVPKLYPVIYTGPKEAKRQIVPGRTGGPIVFNREPDGTLIAYVTESEAQWISKNCVGGEFNFPEGTRDTTDIAALFARVDTLVDRIEVLESRLAEAAEPADTEKPKRTRKPAELATV